VAAVGRSDRGSLREPAREPEADERMLVGLGRSPVSRRSARQLETEPAPVARD
jgi:hypothetical protein